MKTYYLNKWVVLSCLALSFAPAASVSSRAADSTDNRGQLSASDYKFAKEAARGGMTEVNLGKIAADKSVNPAVRQFGQKMVTEHGKAGQDLAGIASKKGAALPTELTAAEQRESERLNKLTGTEFDRAYMNLMVRDHRADEKAFKRAVENVQDPDLKAFAASTLTMVENHRKMAEDLATSIKHEVSMGK